MRNTTTIYLVVGKPDFCHIRELTDILNRALN